MRLIEASGHYCSTVAARRLMEYSVSDTSEDASGVLSNAHGNRDLLQSRLDVGQPDVMQVHNIIQ
jgi:hypothetical protein